MLALAGVVDQISVVVRQTLVQILTPDEKRGRVSAVNSLFIGTSNELGGFRSGLVAWLFTMPTFLGSRERPAQLYPPLPAASEPLWWCWPWRGFGRRFENTENCREMAAVATMLRALMISGEKSLPFQIQFGPGICTST